MGLTQKGPINGGKQSYTYHRLQFPEHGEEEGEERSAVDHHEGLEELEQSFVEADEALQGRHVRTCRWKSVEAQHPRFGPDLGPR